MQPTSVDPTTVPPGPDPERPAPDPVCAAAIEEARTAAEDVAGPSSVGEHFAVYPEGERVVTHYFGCRAHGYVGWHWAVTLARVPRARHASVSEVTLLPGPEAMLAPTWVPWAERIAPGDLGAGDALPYRADDPYLVPGYTVTDEEDDDQLAWWELGLGRVRLLGPAGRDAAAHRWYTGSHGPTADVAVAAAGACGTCAYFVPMAGALRQLFGVCANDWSPSDGTVVSLDHGCGAHSETDAEPITPPSLPEPVLDELGAEPVILPRREDGSGSAAGPPGDQA